MADASDSGPIDHDYPPLEYIIIWLDPHIGKRDQYRQLKKAFASHLDPRAQTYTNLTDRDEENLMRFGDLLSGQFAGIPCHLVTFDNPYECYKAFELYRNKHIYFITSGRMGLDIIPTLVNHYRELFIDPITGDSYHSIYVFCGNIEYHYDWLCEYGKYVLTFTHEADLLARMTRDVGNYCVEQAERHLTKALRSYQWAKKVYDQYRALGFGCTDEVRNVEARTEEIEGILRPPTPQNLLDADDDPTSEPAN